MKTNCRTHKYYRILKIAILFLRFTAHLSSLLYSICWGLLERHPSRVPSTLISAERGQVLPTGRQQDARRLKFLRIAKSNDEQRHPCIHSVYENEAIPLDADVLNHRSKMNPRFLQFLTLSLLYQESHQTNKAVTSGREDEDDNEGKCISPLPAQDGNLEPKDMQDEAVDRDDCKDAHSKCEKWAADGEFGLASQYDYIQDESRW